MKLVVRAEAKADILEIRDWYEARREGLGDKFRLQIRELIARIKRHPRLYAVVLWEARSIRRASMQAFPYGVFYFVEGKTIEVLRVRHDARRPGVTADRS